MSSIVLIDARSNALAISWPATNGASKYRLEYKTTDQDNFDLLTDSLTQTQARKKNLSHEHQYFFRVAPIVNDSVQEDAWITHDKPFQPISPEQEAKSMEAPKIFASGNHALRIAWSQVEGAANGYEIQMRENLGGADWTTIAPSFSGTEVRKKNLTSTSGYQFRLRPSGSDLPFSPPSEPAVALGLSPGIQRWFQNLDGGTLLQSGSKTPVPLADALGGKEFVLLYASAHWCGPCRQFTPMLANWYRTVRDSVEVVFLSADHDENGFESYFRTHPWMAVNFDDDTRESIMATIRVSAVPRLVVLSGKTGKIIEDNAVGKPLDINRWRALNK